MTVETLCNRFKEGLEVNRINLKGNIGNLIEMGFDKSIFDAVLEEYDKEEKQLLRSMGIWIRLNHDRYSPEELDEKAKEQHMKNKHGSRLMSVFFAVADWADEE